MTSTIKKFETRGDYNDFFKKLGKDQISNLENNLCCIINIIISIILILNPIILWSFIIHSLLNIINIPIHVSPNLAMCGFYQG
jgi:hypothetical protein